ncbi:MAG: response regulator transcription factor [Bacteroidetes bacterium]|nr:response regulator transcription factor [Bacteroidota bacterium]MBS1973456.1 response regulator transcription factor [Bacteroidota bacterium]
MQPIRICLVEDLKEVREGMVGLFTLDERFEMLASYTDAESAAEHLPGWDADIVIMDINLPGMSGIECIKKIKKQCPHSQFIMFTIYEDDEKVFEALEAGANGYLLKKTPLSKITEALIELHEGGAPMSTQIARKVIERMHMNEADNESANLTSREHEILQWLAKGLLYKEIADRLNITTGTVRQHIHRIYEKLHVQNRTEAINKAFGNK